MFFSHFGRGTSMVSSLGRLPFPVVSRLSMECSVLYRTAVVVRWKLDYMHTSTDVDTTRLSSVCVGYRGPRLS